MIERDILGHGADYDGYFNLVGFGLGNLGNFGRKESAGGSRKRYNWGDAERDAGEYSILTGWKDVDRAKVKEKVEEHPKDSQSHPAKVSESDNYLGILSGTKNQTETPQSESQVSPFKPRYYFGRHASLIIFQDPETDNARVRHRGVSGGSRYTVIVLSFVIVGLIRVNIQRQFTLLLWI